MAVPGDLKTIRVEEWFDGKALAVTLDLPKGNVLTSAMIGEIQSVVDGVQGRAGCRAVVFRAAGRNFSFGASVDEHRAEAACDMLPRFHRLIRSVVGLDVLTVAAVQGHCLGGGFELVLACDLVFATSSARMGVPEITLGVFPPPASVLLPLKVPAAAAHEIIVTGESADAGRLHALGLVSLVVDDEGLDGAVRDFLERKVLPLSASSLRFANRAAKAVLRKTLDVQLGEVERLYLDVLMKTRDANEGIAAFLEKRKPEWET